MIDSLSKDKVDHLFLLVGRNPLPNYVAVKLLLNENGHFYLLHSADTREEANQLKRVLDSTPCLGEVDESDATSIELKIAQWIDAIPKNERIGLNYTGGTKVMAVHAYRAVRETTRNRAPATVFSYLDTHNYEMKFDPVDGYGGYGEKVLTAVKVPLKTLSALHNIKLGELVERREVLPASTRMLAEFHANYDAAGKWRDWCNSELRRPEMRKKNGWASETKLASNTLNLPADTTFSAFNAQLCTELGLAETSAIQLEDFKSTKTFPKICHFLKWLDGIWLEYYVFDEISAIMDEVDIHDVAMNLDTVSRVGKPNFQFDIGAMKGYQLFGLSCSTTQDKQLAKSKLFEAYIRARQLGGDEARIGLVVPQVGLKQKLEKELPESVQGKVRVFDASHIGSLRKHLQDWFEYPDSH